MHRRAFLAALGAAVAGSGCGDNNMGSRHFSRQRRQPQPPIPTALSKNFVWLGDSITQGGGDPDSNGFRKAVDDMCLAAGYDIDFVGTRAHGTFTDNQHDGFPTGEIADVSSRITSSYGAGKTFTEWRGGHLLIGTNNIRTGHGYNGTTTPAAFLDLMEQAFAAYPAFWLIATMPPIDPASDATGAANMADLVSKIPGLIATYNGNHPGYEATLVDYYNDVFSATYTAGVMADAFHPNVTGYASMAELLKSKVQRLLARR